MKRTIHSLTITDIADPGSSLSGFHVPSSVTVKRTIDRDSAGRFETVELAGKIADAHRDNALLRSYVILSFSYDNGEVFTYGSADYPVKLTIEETEGVSTFKIKYQKPL